MKIYLDTSVLSALFDGRNPERQELTKDIVNMVNTINNFQHIEIMTPAEL